jgi:hypothetical protein
MSLTMGTNQSPRVTTPALNSVGRVGDPGAGTPVTTSQVSGSIVQEYKGMIGGKLTLSQADAARLSDTATALLYGGVYMYVLFYASMSSTVVRGAVVVWVDTSAVSPTCYTVTADGSAARNNFVAGVALNATTKGYYDFIQIAGLASVKFGASLTAATPAVGDAIFVSGTVASPQLADDMAGSTVTTTLLKQRLGAAEKTAPTASGTSLVLLDLIGKWIY